MIATKDVNIRLLHSATLGLHDDVRLLGPGGLKGARSAVRSMEAQGSDEVRPVSGPTPQWRPAARSGEAPGRKPITVFPSGANPADGSEIASGVGDLPGNAGTLDPTLYENGLYTVRIRVTDSDGGVSIVDIEVVIEGAMKLGSFDLAFLDAQWQNGASPMTLGRTYTTLAKDHTGDFCP
ncbi:MAG: hypothetical protein GWP91_11390 [Rhodobacterales bacterium]|nr:hypothetical protein [Rhodobacterales bacterium]